MKWTWAVLAAAFAFPASASGVPSGLPRKKRGVIGRCGLPAREPTQMTTASPIATAKTYDAAAGIQHLRGSGSVTGRQLPVQHW